MRVTVTSSAWSEITSTTVDTVFSAEEGDIRLQTGDTTGVDLKDGFLVKKGDAVVIPAGCDVSAAADAPASTRAVVQTLNFTI